MKKWNISNFIAVLVFINASDLYGQLRLDSQLLKSTRDLTIIDTVFVAFRPGERSINSPFTTVSLKKPIISGLQRTVPEALADIPGIQVQKTNHGGGSPYLRGLTGNQILTVVDGIRLNNSTFRYGPNQYINTVDAMALANMDVALGTGSVQYGSDAIGGALALYYRQADFSTSDGLRISKIGGITRLMNPSVEASQRLFADITSNKVALTMGLTYRYFGDVVAGGTGVKQTPTGYDELNGDAKLRIKASLGEWQVAIQSNNQMDVPVYHKVVLENFSINSMDKQNRQLFYMRRIWPFGKNALARFTTGLQSGNEERIMQKNNSSLSTFEQDRFRTKFILAEFIMPKGKHWIINSGYEFYGDKVLSNRINTDELTSISQESRGLYPDNSKLSQHSIYTMAKAEWTTMQIVIGTRLQQTRSLIPDATLGNILDNNNAWVNTVGLSTTLGKKIPFFNKLRCFGNYSSSFRAPNIDDMGTLGIVDFRYELPQYNLMPEYANNHELGLKWNSNSLKFQVSYYQNYLYNVINRVRLGNDSIQGYPVYQKENIERALTQGLEFYSEITLGGSMFLKLGYATMKGDNLTKAEPMRRIPPASGLVQFNYLWGKSKENRFFMRYTAAASQTRLAAGDISDNRIGRNGTPGYNQLDIGVQFLWKDVRIATSLQNLSNQYIKVHGSGVAMPGRSINLVIDF